MFRVKLKRVPRQSSRFKCSNPKFHVNCFIEIVDYNSPRVDIKGSVRAFSHRNEAWERDFYNRCRLESSLNR